MRVITPFYFNGVRFFLGFLALLPLIVLKRSGHASENSTFQYLISIKAGILLFLAAAFQQVGIINTSAGKAGFITGLYVVIVPFLAMFWSSRKPGIFSFLGAVLAVAGLYFLTVSGRFIIGRGDLLVLISAFFWAVHVIYIGNQSEKVMLFRFAALQFLVCSILSMIMAFIMEPVNLTALHSALLPVLYGGIISVGIAFTLQVLGQRQANPSHAAIILSLESVFAVLGGYLILGEIFSGRALTGCFLMLGGMIVSQLGKITKKAVKIRTL